MIRTGMRANIKLIRKHPKIRRILRCESRYFHHCIPPHKNFAPSTPGISWQPHNQGSLPIELALLPTASLSHMERLVCVYICVQMVMVTIEQNQPLS